MFPSTIRQRSFIASMFILSMVIFLPINWLSSPAFAQTRPASQCSQKKLCALAPASHPDSGGSSSVTLNPSEAPAGGTVTGVGSNWASGDSMLVQWEDGTNLANTTVQNDGTFSVPFTVPSNATQGTHTVYFTDQSAGYFIPATLTVGTCASSTLSVQSVLTQDGNGNNNAIFAPGNAIRYVVYVNNSCGGTINALFHFQDFWGTINDYPLEIFDNIYQNVTLPVGLSGWYVPTSVPTNALPGLFTHEVYVADMNGNQNQGTGYGSFTVTGSVRLSVPYYTQYKGQTAQNHDCGPASVAMVLSYYNKGPGGSKNGLIQVRVHTKNTSGGNLGATDLENALSYYGSFYTEIPRNIPNLPNPDAQLTDIAAAIEQGQPVIAFVHGAALGRGARYGDHWLVVTGFSSDGTNNYILLNDPDNQKPRLPGWIKGGQISLSMSIFRLAVSTTTDTSQPSGIIVTS